ncbi:N-acetyl-gamma-glutamyl-phosphate reductase [Marinomonas posidonica]|uniref:N-acetyl-gamma-glutamyl-phosphate reductase n=1 Tax=Marinomonas posidonica (strain CECT 7376 / NCIMB 14433 / IVIA-Po-181) TaxID=491952 RepID=F6CXJ3_MARPP|nr:N-acetyl-gamma-glutamyl-phosphate reductase [Marinomonas posidonica]AEF55609.1 N-acetyl-gamma-glutamyl-phosphate reductase [Marinomonas posidonica IVIA-Po-181]
MYKIGIVGGTGYTGAELLRLLANHPQVEVVAITSRSEEGKLVSDIYPSLRGHYNLRFTTPSVDELAQCDLVFFATPHGVAMDQVPELIDRGVKVVDLGADFRIKDTVEWAKWYGMDHRTPDYVAKAVYGLPEINRDAIKTAQLVANPGCYPTATQLGLIPLLEAGIIDPAHLIADAKSGVSGAGRGANVGSLLCEASESFRAYGVAGHRHLPEIKQGLQAVTDSPVGLTFVPHLVPMIRGIHSTMYATLIDTTVDLQSLFEARYKGDFFVDVMPAGSLPETRSTKGANFCRIAVYRPQGGDKVVVLSVIDNLVKGASGQAIQNMNIMLDLPENMGLTALGMMP